jgi:hypothetical protein
MADTCARFRCVRDVLTTTLASCAYTAPGRAEGHGLSRLAEKEVRVRACDSMPSVGAFGTVTVFALVGKLLLGASHAETTVPHAPESAPRSVA